MARLLDDLLDVARITQGKLILKTQRVSLPPSSKQRWKPHGR